MAPLSPGSINGGDKRNLVEFVDSEIFFLRHISSVKFLTDFPFLWTSNEAVKFVESCDRAIGYGKASDEQIARSMGDRWITVISTKFDDPALDDVRLSGHIDRRDTRNKNKPGSSPSFTSYSILIKESKNGILSAKDSICEDCSIDEPTRHDLPSYEPRICQGSADRHPTLESWIHRAFGMPFDISDPLGDESFKDLIPHDLLHIGGVIKYCEVMAGNQHNQFSPHISSVKFLTDFPFLWTSNEAVKFVESCDRAIGYGKASDEQIARSMGDMWITMISTKFDDPALEDVRLSGHIDRRDTRNKNKPGSSQGYQCSTTDGSQGGTSDGNKESRWHIYKAKPMRFSRDTLLHYIQSEEHLEKIAGILGEDRKNTPVHEVEKILRQVIPTLYSEMRIGLLEQMMDLRWNRIDREWITDNCLGQPENRKNR